MRAATQERALIRTDRAGTLISGVQPPELREINSCSRKLPSLCYFGAETGCTRAERVALTGGPTDLLRSAFQGWL